MTDRQDRSWLGRIAGKRGENLATAVLVEIMRDPAASGPLLKFFGFEAGCKVTPVLEYPTESDKYGPGRIDLLLKSDLRWLAVECKLGAGLQADQPQKYVETLERKAREDEATSFDVCLLVRVRDKRDLNVASGALKPLGGRGNILFWEDLLHMLRSVEGLSGESAVLLRQLGLFYDEVANPFWPLLTELRKAGSSKWPTSREHRSQFIASLVNLCEMEFVTPGKRIASGNYYIGHYLEFEISPEPKKKAIGFVGFVDAVWYSFDKPRTEGQQDWRFVICVPDDAYNGPAPSAPPEMTLVIRSQSGRRIGIAQDRVLNEQVWTIQNEDLLMGLDDSNALLELWQTRISSVLRPTRPG